MDTRGQHCSLEGSGKVGLATTGEPTPTVVKTSCNLLTRVIRPGSLTLILDRPVSVCLAKSDGALIERTSSLVAWPSLRV